MILGKNESTKITSFKGEINGYPFLIEGQNMAYKVLIIKTMRTLMVFLMKFKDLFDII